jgi:hypothetical protein
MNKVITINKMWNGTPTDLSYDITLSISSSTGDIVILIDAPYHDNKPPPRALSGSKIDDLYDFEIVELFFSGIPYDNENEANCPYLEIGISPHSHYFLAFFMKEAGFLEADRSIVLEKLPNVKIDVDSKRWSGEVSIPFYLLPEPLCAEDLSVSWNFNAFAMYYNSCSERQYLAFSPDLNGNKPNFHQLRYFQTLELYETMEVRNNVDRAQSIANEKLGRIPSQIHGSGSVEKTITDLLKMELLKEGNEDEDDEDEENGVEVSSIPGINKVNSDNPFDGTKTADQTDWNTLSVGKTSDLEEKFQRHIQKDEFVLLHEFLWKRRGISYKKRKLILTSKPRLIYFDPNGIYKGCIQWTMTKPLQLVRVCYLLLLFFSF